jgi:hypothetical protein
MGKPVWTLLPFVADARWMTARSDTPWYPTMRLYRQTTPGDWIGVVGRVADDLIRLSAGATLDPLAQLPQYGLH